MKGSSAILLSFVLVCTCVACGGPEWNPDQGRQIMMPIMPDVMSVDLTLQGKVTDAQSGSPIKGAEVLLYHLSNPSTHENLKGVETNKNGLYSLSYIGEVKRKFVYLTVSKSGYASQEKWVQDVYTPEVQVFDFQLEKSGD